MANVSNHISVVGQMSKRGTRELIAGGDLFWPSFHLFRLNYLLLSH